MLGEGNHIEQSCPTCGHKVDSVTQVDGKPVMPVEGDLSICINCAAALEFQKDGTLIETDITKLSPADRVIMERTQAQIRETLPDVRFARFIDRIRKRYAQ